MCKQHKQIASSNTAHPPLSHHNASSRDVDCTPGMNTGVATG